MMGFCNAAKHALSHTADKDGFIRAAADILWHADPTTTPLPGIAVDHCLDLSEVIWEVCNLFASNLLHDLEKLALEHSEGMVATVFTERSDAIHRSAAEEGKGGS